MSEEFVKSVVEKAQTVIYPSILQLINSYSTQYINTGDRVRDGIFIILTNTIIALLINALYYLFASVGKINVMNESDMINGRLNVNHIVGNHTYLMVTNYPFCVTLNAEEIYNLLDYVETNKCISNYNTFNKNLLLIGDKYDTGSLSNLFIPIKKYYNKNTKNTEYIFYHNYYLFAIDKDELMRFYKLIKKNKEKQIYNNSCKEYDGNKNISEILFSIPHTISFDTIYFEDKPILLEMLDKFKNRTMYPQGINMSNKLGILLYGPPGTGKTGCINAMANYLNRSIVLINSASLYEVESLQKFTKFINDNKTVYIYVFDEFDYLLQDVKNPDNNNSNTNDNDTSANIIKNDIFKEMTVDQQIEYFKNKQTKKKKNVDKSFLLKLLDGLGNDDNRIIVATTNNPDKIDKDLLRPGRFDLKLKLGFCTYQMFCYIVKAKYDLKTIHRNEEHVRKILTLNITPLVLINTMVISHTFDEMCDTLEHMQQTEYSATLQ